MWPPMDNIQGSSSTENTSIMGLQDTAVSLFAKNSLLPNRTVEVGRVGLVIPAQTFPALFQKGLWNILPLWHSTPVTLEGST